MANLELGARVVRTESDDTGTVVARPYEWGQIASLTEGLTPVVWDATSWVSPVPADVLKPLVTPTAPAASDAAFAVGETVVFPVNARLSLCGTVVRVWRRRNGPRLYTVKSEYGPIYVREEEALRKV